MAQSKYGEFFLYEKEGEDDQGKIDTKYGYTLNDFSVRSLFEDNGDTGDAAGCEVVRRNEGIGGNREQERGKSENKSRFYDVDEFDFPIALGQNSLFCPHAWAEGGLRNDYWVRPFPRKELFVRVSFLVFVPDP